MIIEDEDLSGNAERMGRLLRQGLEELQRRFPKNIGDVRGMGLMQAIELVEDETGGNRTPAKRPRSASCSWARAAWTATPSASRPPDRHEARR